MKDRIVMKYRLYGLDGIAKHEKKMLIEWKVIKPFEHMSLRKVKKRVIKWKKDGMGGREQYSTDMSGSNDSNYSFHKIQEYDLNEDAEPLEHNQGFNLQPLCPEIYGKRQATDSNAKFAKMKNRKNQLLMQEMREKQRASM